MPVPGHVCAAAAVLALGIFITAAAFSVSIIYTWERTDSVGATLAVAMTCTCVARAVYVRYRGRVARERRRAYTLPYIRYNGGTDL